ncbi:MAG TPA: tetratricopeptide repeat protein [Victivallales bacterium]|nr:tetratricopeptide repeat protein [Victivallales bacterium]HPO90711.1 tetratricopeptide repeat protein [Victivallales bacterium]
MSDKEKDKFSFESVPNKIGRGEKQGNEKENTDFSFDDVPVLGKKEKSGSIVDLLGGAVSSPQKKRPVKEEKIDDSPLKLKENNNNNLADTVTESKDIFSSDLDTWLDATPKKKDNKKLFIAVASIVVVVIVFFAIFIILVKTLKKGDETQLPVERKKSLSKEDLERIRLEEQKRKIEEEIASAEKLISENEISTAEARLNELKEKYPEKSAIYNTLGRAFLKKHDIESAKEHFIKAISTGTEIPEPFVQLCKILLSQDKLSQAADFAEKGLKKFPEDQELLKIAAKIALKNGNRELATQLYDKTSKSELSQIELTDYAALLAQKNEKKKAREIYVYTGKKFLDPKSFEKAVSIEDDPIEKNAIINTAISVFEKDQYIVSRMLILLVKELLKAGRKDMALEKSKAIDPVSLDDNDSILFIELNLDSSGDVILKDKIETIISSKKDNFLLIQKIYFLLVKNGKNALAAEIFSEFWAKNPDNIIFEYFYAKSLDPLEESIKYYKDVISKKNNFPEALYDLGNCLIAHRRYTEAEKYLTDASRLKPKDFEIHRSLFLSKFYNNRKKEFIIEFKNYLKSIQYPDINNQIIEYAQQLNDGAFSNEIISEMERNGNKDVLYWKVRHDIIYWNNPEKYFNEYFPQEIRDLYIAYLLAKGKFKDILLLPTPPEKFPEFWKVFILWVAKKEGWEELAQTFREKNKYNSSYELITSVMLSKTDPEDARRQIYRVSHELENVFYLVLAEKFKLDGLKIKAKVCYSKAIADYPHIYRKVIELLEKY